jgi:hypothetical protein
VAAPNFTSQSQAQQAVQETTNYLVPSSGATHCIPLSGTLIAGQPAILDWRQFATDSFAFQPQGAYIDNSQSANPVTIQVFAGGSPSGGGALIWSITVGAGKVRHTPFPAPNGQVHSISGNGFLNIVYADFPVMPFNEV